MTDELKPFAMEYRFTFGDGVIYKITRYEDDGETVIPHHAWTVAMGKFHLYADASWRYGTGVGSDYWTAEEALEALKAVEPPHADPPCNTDVSHPSRSVGA